MTSSELLNAQVQREREWAYALWLARHSYSGIRRMARLPEEDGGLGYDLSESAIRGLVKGAREDRGDLSTTREERAERRQAERDELARLARGALHVAAAAGTVDHDSAKLLMGVHKAEREEHGDDAAQRAEVTVTTRDAVTEELNAMLARAGARPSPERTAR